MAEVLGPGEGHARFTARGSVMFFKALAGLDDGDLSLMERTLPPGGRRPPPHRHTNCSEAYFVLDGLVSISVEDEELQAGPEGFVLVPRGFPELRDWLLAAGFTAVTGHGEDARPLAADHKRMVIVAGLP